MTVEAVSSNFASLIGPTPAACFWAINSCKRSLSSASERDKGLDSLMFLDLWSQVLHIEVGTAPQDRPDPPSRLSQPTGQRFR